MLLVKTRAWEGGSSVLPVLELTSTALPLQLGSGGGVASPCLDASIGFRFEPTAPALPPAMAMALRLGCHGLGLPRLRGMPLRCGVCCVGCSLHRIIAIHSSSLALHSLPH